ncbi:MAG: TRZ/ATZ family hydrolase [Burkholderiales bacterium]
MENIDLLIAAKWVIPVEPDGVVLETHSVAVRDGLIVAVLPTPVAAERFSAAENVDLAQHALIPGLVNLHTHAAMTLMRGLADDLPLMTWLGQHIWPTEANHVSPEFVRDGTRLACMEMLAGGITCFNDMYFYPEATAQAALECGMRASIGIITIDLPTRYASDADDYLTKGLAARDRFKEHPTLSFSLAPHAPYTVSDKTFERVVTIAEELDLPIHMHLHETRDEIDSAISQHGNRPIARMEKLGVLGPRLIAVHSVHLQEREIELLARHSASVAHCPSSNLKLASGIAPVDKILTAGINLGLGTDGAASNNRLDMFQEMRLAALLAKGSSGNAEAMPAAAALRAATLNGARAMGLEQKIGSIVPGKAADLCAVNFASPNLTPCFDPISHLAYVAGRENVSHVWVAGQLRVVEGKLPENTRRDVDKIAALWQDKLVAETKG